jgi:hypothetical protein
MILARERSKRIFGEIAISYVVLPRRLLVKFRVRQPNRLRAHFLAWGDLIMMRKQLRTLKALAEGSAKQRSTSTRDVQSPL